MAGAYGVGAGYFASRWYGRRKAEVKKGERERAGFEVAGIELDGTKLGAGAALAGAIGILGDDTYDQVLYATGLSVLVADQAIDAYEEKLDEPPV